MVSISGCGPNEQRFFGLASREYPLNQHFNTDRSAQSLTKSQRIAIEEHRIFHLELGDFGLEKNLDEHITLMIMGIKQGMDFIQSHIHAINVGPKPDK